MRSPRARRPRRARRCPPRPRSRGFGAAAARHPSAFALRTPSQHTRQEQRSHADRAEGRRADDGSDHTGDQR
ncbi:hypothetical protein CW368_08380 [Actinomycetales bacterium SN12]|nr:hypothetical protein CW368_08380 [Actinomycetales bacterium SN12]